MCNHLINPDIAPTTPEQRTWRWHHYLALWLGMGIAVPAYMLAAVPVAINLPGFLLSAFPVAFTSVPGPFVRLYDWVWFFGVALALAIHTGLMTVRRGTLATA